MAEDSEPLVKIRGLRFSRGSRVIFDGVDIDIPRGGITAIMGPSGTGKTTLLKLIGGQLRPTRAASTSTGKISTGSKPAICIGCVCALVCCSRAAPC